ncbi:MAG: three-Cys-motif partner protein TcmP [Bacteroidota bacterium]
MVRYPSFFFVDPWGYKGLTRDLIEAVLKGWGSDCFFFLNYARVNAAITNSLVERHMTALFGEERLQRLRVLIHTLEKRERDICLLNELAEALRERGARYMLPFAFRQSSRTQPTHYLVFVSKHVLGYEIAKDIMTRCGQKEEGGSWFEHIAVPNPQLSLLRDLTPGPVDELGRLLIQCFGGKELTFAELYAQVGKGKPYTKQDIREALMQLRASGDVVVKCPTSPTRVRADRVEIGTKAVITFVNKVQTC